MSVMAGKVRNVFHTNVVSHKAKAYVKVPFGTKPPTSNGIPKSGSLGYGSVHRL